MTEAQIVLGILQNDNRVWQHICRRMKPSFASIIKSSFNFGTTAAEDMEDIFQESCIILMQKVKEGQLVLTREGALFSYLVQIGKLTACNLMKKRNRNRSTSDETPNISPFVSVRGTQIPDIRKEQENEPGEVSISEKQQAQNELIDRAFDSLPDTCKTIFKNFYWERKQFDEIADIIGFGSADSVKTKKNRCMKKFVDFAKSMLDSNEFDEEIVRAAVERAVLRELISEETVYAETGVTMAALDIDEETDSDDK